MSAPRLEELRTTIDVLALKTEALGWRLAAHVRELAAARVKLELALGHVPTLPLELRPPVKAKPR